MPNIHSYSSTDGAGSKAKILAQIASYCGRPERSGKSFKSNCPVCGRHSFCIAHKRTGGILVHCFHCESLGLNDGWSEQRAWLVEAGLLPSETCTTEPIHNEEFDAEQRAYAQAVWNQLYPITPKSDAAKYLHARGLSEFIGHPALRCAGLGRVMYGEFRPVLAARAFHVNYGLSAVQVTYLELGGADREREIKPGRRTYGQLKGAAVWFGKPDPDTELVVAEGIESCLSAMLLLGAQYGAAVLGPNLAGLMLPSAAQRIHIAADNDETGRGASARAAREWRALGKIVRVSWPDEQGEDFNDLLMKGARQ